MPSPKRKEERKQKALSRFLAQPLDVQLHERFINEGPFMRSQPDVSLEWIGKYEDFGGVWETLTTATEEKALLGEVGAKFDTPEKADLLLRYRYQHAVGNHLLFCNLLPREVLDRLAELSGYGKKARPAKILDQGTIEGYSA